MMYPTYLYFFIIIIITKIQCWPVFKQDPLLLHVKLYNEGAKYM